MNDNFYQSSKLKQLQPIYLKRGTRCWASEKSVPHILSQQWLQNSKALKLTFSYCFHPATWPYTPSSSENSNKHELVMTEHSNTSPLTWLQLMTLLFGHYGVNRLSELDQLAQFHFLESTYCCLTHICRKQLKMSTWDYVQRTTGSSAGNRGTKMTSKRYCICELQLTFL